MKELRGNARDFIPDRHLSCSAVPPHTGWRQRTAPPTGFKPRVTRENLTAASFNGQIPVGNQTSEDYPDDT
jgi:hypothetical protein